MIIRRWLTTVAIVVVTVAGLAFIKISQIQAAIAFGESFPEPSATVLTTHAETLEYRSTSKVMGQIKATQNITVSNELSGLITKVNFEPGELVSKGQVLLQQDIRNETTDLKAAKARLKLAKASYQRLFKLLKQKRVSQEDVDQAEANVSITKAQVESLETTIDRKTIHAPFAGQVGLTQFQVGQLLPANSPVTTLVGIGNAIWVDFMLPQTMSPLTNGDTIKVNLIQNDNLAQTSYAGKIITRSAVVDPNSRQIQYRALLNNDRHLLHHNQIVSVVISEAAQKLVIVPSSAITRNHFGDFVYKLELDDKQNFRAKSVPVSLGQRIQDQQIITNGLTGGEYLATEGAFKLRDNLLVYPGDEQYSTDESDQGMN